jgi:hypothetical protein
VSTTEELLDRKVAEKWKGEEKRRKMTRGDEKRIEETIREEKRSE